MTKEFNNSDDTVDELSLESRVFAALDSSLPTETEITDSSLEEAVMAAEIPDSQEEEGDDTLVTEDESEEEEDELIVTPAPDEPEDITLLRNELKKAQIKKEESNDEGEKKYYMQVMSDIRDLIVEKRTAPVGSKKANKNVNLQDDEDLDGLYETEEDLKDDFEVISKLGKKAGFASKDEIKEEIMNQLREEAYVSEVKKVTDQFFMTNLDKYPTLEAQQKFLDYVENNFVINTSIPLSGIKQHLKDAHNRIFPEDMQAKEQKVTKAIEKVSKIKAASVTGTDKSASGTNDELESYWRALGK